MAGTWLTLGLHWVLGAGKVPSSWEMRFSSPGSIASGIPCCVTCSSHCILLLLWGGHNHLWGAKPLLLRYLGSRVRVPQGKVKGVMVAFSFRVRRELAARGCPVQGHIHHQWCQDQLPWGSVLLVEACHSSVLQQLGSIPSGDCGTVQGKTTLGRAGGCPSRVRTTAVRVSVHRALVMLLSGGLS